mgnify:CR=1 FL=1
MGEYSVAIRTLGRAGEKYRKLLDSIRNAAHQPEKVVVVLPEGFDPPKEQLGWEQFVYCPKSMIGQRLEALKYIDSEYTLFLDDDIAFEPEFPDKLLKPMDQGMFDCATGPLFSFFPASKAGAIVGTLTMSCSVSIFRRDLYVKILRSGGWSYHTFDTGVEHYYPTESFAWTCFMIRTDVMRKLEMEDEVCWLEKFGYAYGDDQVMANKLLKRGYGACIVSNALYEHNDAKTATSSQEMVNTKPSFCVGFFRAVFWKRFIQDQEASRIQRLLNWLCFAYWRVSMRGYHLLKSVKPHNRPQSKAFFKGIKEGRAFVKTEEYKMLAPVIKNR